MAVGVQENAAVELSPSHKSPAVFKVSHYMSVSYLHDDVTYVA